MERLEDDRARSKLRNQALLAKIDKILDPSETPPAYVQTRKKLMEQKLAFVNTLNKHDHLWKDKLNLDRERQKQKEK